MKPALAILLALLAGAAGGVAASFLRPSRAEGPAAASDGHALAELRDAVAALERRIGAAPGLAAGSAPPPVSAASGSSGAPAASSGPHPAGGPDGRATADLLREVAEKAAEAVLEKQAAKAKEVAKASERKKATVAEASREIGLSAAQEDELRTAYTDATEKYLKVLSEPDSTPDALRRELEASKGDPAKRAGLVAKYMPKLMTKLGDVMAIETEKEARIAKAVGKEKMPAYRKFKIAEDDPFGFDDDDGDDMGLSIGVTTSGD